MCSSPEPMHENSNNWEVSMDRLERIARKAIYRLHRSGCEHRDIVSSAVGSYLREESDLGIDIEEEHSPIWSRLAHHLRRKLDKYRHRANYKKNGLPDESSLELPLAELCIEEKAVVDEKVAAESVESYLHYLLNGIDELVADEELSEITKLAVMGYKNVEISQQLGLSESAISRRLSKIKLLLNEAREQDEIE